MIRVGWSAASRPEAEPHAALARARERRALTAPGPSSGVIDDARVRSARRAAARRAPPSTQARAGDRPVPLAGGAARFRRRCGLRRSATAPAEGFGDLVSRDGAGGGQHLDPQGRGRRRPQPGRRRRCRSSRRARRSRSSSRTSSIATGAAGAAAAAQLLAGLGLRDRPDAASWSPTTTSSPTPTRSPSSSTTSREYPAKLIGTRQQDRSGAAQDRARRAVPVSSSWADSDEVRVGDWMIAIGNPFGLGSTVTAGIVSARGRDIRAGPYDDFFQVDAADQPRQLGRPQLHARRHGVRRQHRDLLALRRQCRHRLRHPGQPRQAGDRQPDASRARWRAAGWACASRASPTRSPRALGLPEVRRCAGRQRHAGRARREGADPGRAT